MMRLLAFLLIVIASALPAPAKASELTDRLEALASQNNGEALYHLGMVYHLGLEGVAIDYRRALEYFRRSSEAGDPLGAYKLGCYYAGQGDGVIAADPDLALRYKLVAAEAGYGLAQIDLGQVYAGRGDHNRALHWFDAAARQGSWDALFMAMFKVMPGGVIANRPRAWLYHQVMVRTLSEMQSESAGETMTEDEQRQMRDNQAEMQRELERDMTASDRAEAERLLAEWRIARSPLSQRADLQMDGARRLVGMPEETPS